MLFDLGTNKSIGVPEWATKEMKELYPEFYAGKPLVLSSLRKNKVRLVDTNDRESGGRTILKAPDVSGHKAIGSVLQPDKTVLNFRYGRYAPSMNNGQLNFAYPNGVVDLHDRFQVNETQEDLLFYLTYGCRAIEGNKAGGKNPMYKFERIGADSLAKIKDFNRNKKLEDFIYNQLDYNVLLNAFQILNIPATVIDGDSEGTQSANRIKAYDYVRTASETAKQNILDLLGFEKKTGASVVEEDPNTLVNRLINEGKIAIGDMGWYEKDKRGEGNKLKSKPFFETVTADADVARFALVDFFKASADTFNEFKNK